MKQSPPLRVAFRADAARWIGSGHVMRCATLAAKLRDEGAEVHFLCRELPGNYCEWLKQQGFTVHTLTPASSPLPSSTGTLPKHSGWLGVPLEQEINESRDALLALGRLDWIVIDHYSLDARWEMAMSQISRRIMVIDDLADRTHHCKLLLDQNLQINQNRYTKLLTTDTLQLIGPRFALVPAQFTKLRAAPKKLTEKIEHLLIFFGGMDAENITKKVMACVDFKQLSEKLKVDVVIGAGNPHHDQITAACSKLPAVTLHIQTAKMAELMATADLMVGAPGTTTWERCCLGLPSILLSVAPNQRDNGVLIAKKRAGIYLGDATDSNISKLTTLLPRLSKHPALTKKMSVNAYNLVDGKGVLRTSIALNNEALKLRRASAVDCKTVWEWRNDPRTRRFAFNTTEIPFAQHQQWYRDVMSNSQQQLLIGMVNSHEIGVLRYDKLDSGWEISVYLDPDLHGLGLGNKLISAGNQWLSKNLASPHRVIARTVPNNTASCKAFRKAGFLPVADTLQWQANSAADFI